MSALPAGHAIHATTRFRTVAVVALVALLAPLMLVAGSGRAVADPAPPETPPSLDYLDNLRPTDVTLAGGHNTYNKKGYPREEPLNDAQDNFHYAFDSLHHTQTVELDVWNFTTEWWIKHDNPDPFTHNDNNCPKAGIIGASRNQDLNSCLEGLRRWHDRHPNHPLVIVKLEMKNGFFGGVPNDLDQIISDPNRLPSSMLFTPFDLMGCTRPPRCTYNTPDEAARAGAWPTMGELRGKFMFTMISGTVTNGSGGLLSDGPATYARAMRTGGARVVFPSLLMKSAIQGQDPRPQLFGQNWPFVVMFDMEHGYLPGYDTPQGAIPLERLQWMRSNNYFTFVTYSQPAPPCSTSLDPNGCRQGLLNIVCPQYSDRAFCEHEWRRNSDDKWVDIPAGRAAVARLVQLAQPNVVDTDQERLGLWDPQPIRTIFPTPVTSPIVSDPAVAQWASGRLELVGLDAGGALRHRSFGPRGWGDWTSLGGSLTGVPAVVAYDNADMVVAATDTLGRVWWQAYRNSIWSGWSLSGDTRFAGGVTALSSKEGRVDLFGRLAATGETLHGVLDTNAGRLTGWENLGGVATSVPHAIAPRPGDLDVFVRGTDGRPWRRLLRGGTWGGWQAVGGDQILGAPVPVSFPTPTGPDWLLYTRDPNGIFRFFRSCDLICTGLGQLWIGIPSWAGDFAATSAPTGTTTIFGRGTDGVIYLVARNNQASTVTGIVVVTPSPTSPRFVKAAYQDFLGRQPTADELATAVGLLDANTLTRGQVVTLLASSKESAPAVVTRLYHHVLHRAGDAQDLTYWVDEIWSREHSVTDVTARFYASSEYYNLHGGTDSSWVTDLYQKLLLRKPDEAGLQYWVARTAEDGRRSVALHLYQSRESLKVRVTNLYEQFVGRTPDATELARWSQDILTRGDVVLAADLAASSEYNIRAQTRIS